MKLVKVATTSLKKRTTRNKFKIKDFTIKFGLCRYTLLGLLSFTLTIINWTSRFFGINMIRTNGFTWPELHKQVYLNKYCLSKQVHLKKYH